jgi:hypothetical protein
MHSLQCHDAAAPRMSGRIEGFEAVILVEVLLRISETVGLVREDEGGGLLPGRGNGHDEFGRITGYGIGMDPMAKLKQ